MRLPYYPSYEEARQAFFGDPETGNQRIIIDTNVTAPGNGIIIGRLFIKEETAAGGILYGDNRDFSNEVNASSRITVAWDTETGQVSYTGSASRTRELSVSEPHFSQRFPWISLEKHFVQIDRLIPALEICDGCANSIRVNGNDETNYLKVEVSGLNSYLPCCETNAEIYFNISPGETRIALAGDDYPDFEAVQYRRYAPPRNLAKSYAGSWLGGLNTLPITFPRLSEWSNGVCVMGFGC